MDIMSADKIKQDKHKMKFTRENIENPENINFSGAFYNVDNSLNLQNLMDNIQINIISIDKYEAVLDIIGIDAPIANALRRIMISEVPTMAIEKVLLYQNTSIIPDEILVHRLGLIPIQVDPRLFDIKKAEEDYNDKNHVKFYLNVKCEKKNKDQTLPIEEQFSNTQILSKQLKWIPQGNQKEIFSNNPIKAVLDEILIAKLRENQEIECELICEKGIGKVHAKWSPVSTASYRLKPEITFKEPIINEEAQQLVNLCPKNVFELESQKKKKVAVVANIRDCTMCRECIRPDNFNEIIELSKTREHYIFTIESVGQMTPIDILKEAIKIFKSKAGEYLSGFD